MDFEHLSSSTKIPGDKVNQVWEDFVSEIKKACVSRGTFVYNDLLGDILPLKSFRSEYVSDLIYGRTTVEEFTKDMTDERKADFAKIIYFLLKRAARQPYYVEELGTFYLHGLLGGTVRNPQTGELVKTSLHIGLGFNPNF